eukprot:1681724-Amphidinium_carterae.1
MLFFLRSDWLSRRGFVRAEKIALEDVVCVEAVMAAALSLVLIVPRACCLESSDSRRIGYYGTHGIGLVWGDCDGVVCSDMVCEAKKKVPKSCDQSVRALMGVEPSFISSVTGRVSSCRQRRRAC